MLLVLYPQALLAMKKIANAGVLLAVMLAPAWAQTAFPAPAASGQTVAQLASVVSGIVSYTRWPTAPHAIRLCVLGHPGLLAQLATGGASVPGQRHVVAQAVHVNEDVLLICDAVYVSAMPPENARRLLYQVVGHPVLTVGEGTEFCSDGGMFCLAGGQRFSANLDAIARSGLRVNPQVLRLARAVPSP